MTDLFEIRDRKLVVHNHPGQKRALRSGARFVFVLAGTQSGKTEVAPVWMHREIQTCGPGDYIAASPSFPLMQKKLLPVYERYFVNYLKAGEYRMTDRILVLNKRGMDAKIFFGSADKPDSLESATAKAAHLDEVGQASFRLPSWEAILRRLSIHQGRVLGTTTLYNLGWMKSEVYDRWKSGDPDYDVIQFDSIENPAFPRDEYDRARRTLPAWKFNMFYRGQYDRPAGMIYDCFEDELRIPRFALNPAWPRFVGIDFGGTHTAAVWLAKEEISRDFSKFYLYRKYLEGGRTARGHAEAFRDFSRGENVQKWIGGSKSEEQWRKEFQAAGIPVEEPPISDVEVGIQRVYALFKTKALYVFSDQGEVLDEIGTYSRKLDDRGQPTEDIADKETFHLLDALRYVGAVVGGPRVDPVGVSEDEQDHERRRSRIWDR